MCSWCRLVEISVWLLVFSIIRLVMVLIVIRFSSVSRFGLVLVVNVFCSCRWWCSVINM